MRCRITIHIQQSEKKKGGYTLQIEQKREGQYKRSSRDGGGKERKTNRAGGTSVLGDSDSNAAIKSAFSQCKYFSFKRCTCFARYGQLRHRASSLFNRFSSPAARWCASIASQPRRLYNKRTLGWMSTDKRRERTMRYASTSGKLRCFITYAIYKSRRPFSRPLMTGGTPR